MEDKQPLLSICIPTYNRARVLKETIRAISDDPDFDQEVELVISDNCSTDETEAVVNVFANKFKNIRYYRNDTNIRDKNFSKAFLLGNGLYVKLQNDNLSFSDGSLKLIKDKIREGINSGVPIFFSGGRVFTKKKQPEIYCNSCDEFIQAISSYVTFLSGFGAWKKDFCELQNIDRFADLLLAQVDWTYKIVSRYNKAIIYDYDIYNKSKIPLGKRSGYNFFQVHIDNYYKIMKPYIDCKLISKYTYSQDRKNVLIHFRPELFNTFVMRYNKNFQFDTSGTFNILWRYYKDIPSFYMLIFLYPFLLLMIPISSLLRIKAIRTIAKKIINVVTLNR